MFGPLQERDPDEAPSSSFQSDQVTVTVAICGVSQQREVLSLIFFQNKHILRGGKKGQQHKGCLPSTILLNFVQVVARAISPENNYVQIRKEEVSVFKCYIMYV